MPVQGAELVDLAVAALGEVTDPASVGPLVDATEREPGVVDLGFDCLLPGYPGWRWTVSTARLDGADPTVLEVELLPGDGSLLAPPWVPWAERLAEYRRTHGDAAAADESDEESDEESDDDDDDEDASADLDPDDDSDDDDEDSEFDEDEDGDLDEDDDADELDDDVDDELDDGIDVEAAAGVDEADEHRD